MQQKAHGLLNHDLIMFILSARLILVRSYAHTAKHNIKINNREPSKWKPSVLYYTIENVFEPLHRHLFSIFSSATTIQHFAAILIFWFISPLYLLCLDCIYTNIPDMDVDVVQFLNGFKFLVVVLFSVLRAIQITYLTTCCTFCLAFEMNKWRELLEKKIIPYIQLDTEYTKIGAKLWPGGGATLSFWYRFHNKITFTWIEAF